MPLKPLDFATSKTLGGVTEIAVLAPIRRGRIPGERRTYEERLRFVISTIQKRVEQGIPIELDRVHSIHFGRLIIIRPEQYLVYSDLPGIAYENDCPGEPAPSSSSFKIPQPIDDYLETELSRTPERLELRSWLLTLVAFDGDLKVYFREIAEFVDNEFDNVFRNCEDFPSTDNFEAFWAWVRRYQIRCDLFYTRYPNLSVVRIRQLEEFKRRFDAFVAKVRTPTGKRTASMDELFDEFLRENQQHASGFPTAAGTYETGDC
ncbi:hypothetical protein [Mesorhizobium sp. L-8-3]|uniref:hypothetical protein n=1 Tax=Mesorhizobium sp. L-8-3 TaxID=2744522 RepID=UPI0019253F82|nr:hypothetical protein [Mesorhizobium sp. L-8-3]BCH22662.1 hypothetical protein MesoLjLb_24470 [Mesorhizobium sp. L-8-3]